MLFRLAARRRPLSTVRPVMTQVRVGTARAKMCKVLEPLLLECKRKHLNIVIVRVFSRHLGCVQGRTWLLERGARGCGSVALGAAVCTVWFSLFELFTATRPGLSGQSLYELGQRKSGFRL